MSGGLDGKIVLVVGAGGIGAATARLLAQRGARIAVSDLNVDTAEAVAAAVRNDGGEAIALRIDLADEATIASTVQSTVDRYGRIEVLYNNAADLSRETAARDGDIETMSVELWDRTFRINLRGIMLCCKHVLPHMVRQGGGSIINTASNLALQGHIVQSAYAASKAAMLQMTRSIAASHGRRGIRCNAVSPGLVLTRSAREHLPSRVLEMVAAETLTPYLGAPDDIAYAVAYLASDEARYVTGHNLVVDGGTATHVPGIAPFSEFIASP